VFCVGCSGNAPSAPRADQPSEIEQALAGLSPADRALAERQKVCLVSGEALGSMGTPVKLEHGDLAVLLCCEGCRESFTSEPNKYLAKAKP